MTENTNARIAARNFIRLIEDGNTKGNPAIYRSAKYGDFYTTSKMGHRFDNEDLLLFGYGAFMNSDLDLDADAIAGEIIRRAAANQ